MTNKCRLLHGFSKKCDKYSNGTINTFAQHAMKIIFLKYKYTDIFPLF